MGVIEKWGSLVIRTLESADYHKGYVKLLQQLTDVGEVSEEAFTGRLKELEKFGEHHQVAVIEDVEKKLIVATGTLVIELKIVRGCGKVGHIEDIVVDDTVRGQHLGQRVVNNLTGVAKAAGCYKVILDCKLENAPFYEKCGFQRKEIQMAKYF